MTRKAAMAVIRFAGYHEDTRKFVRTYVENRISYATARQQWAIGVREKQRGAVCDCFACKRARGAV